MKLIPSLRAGLTSAWEACKKPSRLALAALVLGVLFSVNLAAFESAHAQTPAPAAAPAAAAPKPATPPAPATPPPPPACDANHLTVCTPNSGDTAWMLTSMALVLMMTVPGLGLFYGGMVRKKNVVDTVMTSFAITCIVTFVFAAITYSLAFTPGSAFIGGTDACLPARYLERRLEQHRQSEPAGADDSGNGLYGVPDDLRDHHPGPHRRRLRRAHEILGHGHLHDAVGDLRLRADRALGLGSGWSSLQRQPESLGPRPRLRRRYGRSHQLRCCRFDVRPVPRQAA